MNTSPSDDLMVSPTAQLDSLLSQGTDPALVGRDFLQTSRSELTARFTPGQTITPFLRQISDMVDAVLTRLWLEYVGAESTAALIAVGGYGRGELFPQSDIDVLILTRDAPDVNTAGRLERFVTSLWDTGLQIGHSVRTLQE